MDYKELQGLFVGSDAELLAKTEELTERQIAINVDTGDVVSGPGMYADLVSPKTPVALRVDAVQTTNVTIASGLNAGDTAGGKVLVDGDVVLLIAETANATNGPYVVGNTPARHPDFTTFDSIAGKAFYCTGGTNARKTYRCYSAAGGALGTDPLAFVQAQGVLLSLAGKNQLANVVASSSVTGTYRFLAENPTTGELEKVTGAVLKTYVTS